MKNIFTKNKISTGMNSLEYNGMKLNFIFDGIIMPLIYFSFNIYAKINTPHSNSDSDNFGINCNVNFKQKFINLLKNLTLILMEPVK